MKDLDEETMTNEENKVDMEEGEEMELEKIDLQRIVSTCEIQEAHSIPNKHIQLLKSTLLKSKHKEKVVAA
jgi:hypothetical protein